MDLELDRVYMGVKKFFDIDIIWSMRDVLNIWTEMSQSVIFNSWGHTDLKNATVDTDAIPTSADEEHLIKLMNHSVPLESRMFI